MKFGLRRELPILLAMTIPFLYLKLIWNSLPMKVPIHWDINGEADNWTTKTGLLLTISSVLLFSYVPWLLLQRFKNQNWIQQLGEKFYHLRLIFSVFFSVICFYIIHSALNQSTNINFIVFLIGCLVAVIGNYTYSLKPNYFLGIRTPWTLKNELVWKKTHRFSSRLMVIFGILIMFLGLFQKQYNFINFLIIAFIMICAPILFSFITYKQIPKQ